jgi:flagellar basal body-associated protein FliL
MQKILKWVGIVVAVLAVVLFIAFKFMQNKTKQASPEATVVYKKEATEISVFYCQPSKKGREIFGGIIPFGKVWRTGANEATTFTTNEPVKFGDKIVPAGKYTLWTIPEADHWTVILNSKQYSWGVSFGGVASREAEADIAQIQVPVETVAESVEKFTVSFNDSTQAMILAWDKTKVTVPLK